MPDGRRHAPYLAIAALGQDQLDPGLGDAQAPADRRLPRRQPRRGRQQPDPARPGGAVAEYGAGGQTGQGLGAGHPLHLRQIGPRVPEAGIGQPAVQRPVVGKQEQALAVMIQPARGINSFRQAEARQARMAVVVRELGKDAVRLVKNNDPGAAPGRKTAPAERGAYFPGRTTRPDFMQSVQT